jgi:chromosome segregation and condensation protein ScpB
MAELVAVVEALIFVADEPITSKLLAEVLDEDKDAIDAAVVELQKEYEGREAVCRYERSPAAGRSRRGPSCTRMCGSF